MASYSNSNYSNGFYDLSGIYLNPVSSSSSSSSSSTIDLTTLDKRYLKLSGGTISNNLIITNTLDVLNSIELPLIGDVELEIQSKQDFIEDAGLEIVKINGLSESLELLQDNIDDKQNTIDSSTDITLNSIIVNTLELGKISNVEEAIGDKQDIIQIGGLAIDKINYKTY